MRHWNNDKVLCSAVTMISGVFHVLHNIVWARQFPLGYGKLFATAFTKNLIKICCLSLTARPYLPGTIWATLNLTSQHVFLIAVDTCPPVGNITFGTRICKHGTPGATEMEVNDYCEFTCNKGHRISGHTTIRCTVSGYDYVPPVCQGTTVLSYVNGITKKLAHFRNGLWLAPIELVPTLWPGLVC